MTAEVGANLILLPRPAIYAAAVHSVLTGQKNQIGGPRSIQLELKLQF
jgi:hypothetical protein